jgi:ferrous iron transport protein B
MNGLSTGQRVRVALAGNPNAGKTSIFNGLTGARQKVGNYPGVTVEKRIGAYAEQSRTFEVIDLPGSYSLSSFTPEERIAQNELLWSTPDVVVVVADSMALARSLVILAQIMHLRTRFVLCLNMSDEARRAGQRLNLEQLEMLLGMEVVETVGHKREGIVRLKNAIRRALEAPPPPRRLVLGGRLEEALAQIAEPLADEGLLEGSKEWLAVRLLVDETQAGTPVSVQEASGREALARAQQWRQRLEAETDMDISMYVTERYYGFVDGLLREVTLRRPRQDARRVSDTIDRVLAHRLWGLPFFLAAMYGLFWLTFTVGQYPMDWIEGGFQWLAQGITAAGGGGEAGPLQSLLVDGIINGVGGVVVFLPNIVLLFLGLAFMEDTGYMGRAAFLTDSLMHRFGLHGRSFIPLLTGFGCSVPGIMATRTLENERDRLATMMVLPLMSCGARLPIWMLLVPAFFAPAWRAPVLWLVYMAGIALALVLALVLRRSVLRGEEAPFVMELPPYRLPTLRAVLHKMLERSWLYLKKAGTVILAISILMWAAASYPKLDHYAVDQQVRSGLIEVVEAPPMQGAERAEASASSSLGDSSSSAVAGESCAVQQLTAADVEHRRAAEGLQHSLAGRLGRVLEPILRPMGADWRVGTALVGAFAAKEVFVAQLGIVYSLGEADEGTAGLQQSLRRDYSPAAGLALMLFLLIAAPCMATVAITRRESGSWKWALAQFGGLTVLGYVVAVVTYQVGQLFG